MTVTCTETAECDKWAEIVALAQQGNKKMLGVILQAFDIKLRKIAHTSAYKGFAEDGEQIERIAVVKAKNGDSGRISRSCRLLSSVSRIRRSAVNGNAGIRMKK